MLPRNVSTNYTEKHYALVDGFAVCESYDLARLAEYILLYGDIGTVIIVSIANPELISQPYFPLVAES
jgi:hypothetical protein